VMASDREMVLPVRSVSGSSLILPTSSSKTSSSVMMPVHAPPGAGWDRNPDSDHRHVEGATD
jgi:hypothetical protein